MLHFFLLILKIIGWILLAILGILVLLVCVVLFVPVRYELDGKCNGTIDTLDVKFRFSFLLHFLAGTVCYTEGKPTWNLRIAWKRFVNQDTELQETPIKKSVESESSVNDAKDEEINVPEEPIKNEESVSEESVSEESIAKETVSKETVSNMGKSKATDRDTDRDTDKATDKAPDQTGKVKKTVSKKESVLDKIEYKYKKIRDKLREIARKKEKVMGFLTNEIHQAAFLKVIIELKRLLLRLRPQKIMGEIEFGFDDPAWTGQVLAGISILYPYFADCFQVIPDFEEKKLRGQLEIKGKISAKNFAALGLRVILDKNVRMTLRHIKTLK